MHYDITLNSCVLPKVDMALRDMEERKASSAASSFSSMSEDDEGAGLGQAAQASLDLSDSMSEGLRLRSEMQRAVQEERCGGWCVCS